MCISVKLRGCFWILNHLQWITLLILCEWPANHYCISHASDRSNLIHRTNMFLISPMVQSKADNSVSSSSAAAAAAATPLLPQHNGRHVDDVAGIGAISGNTKNGLHESGRNKSNYTSTPVPEDAENELGVDEAPMYFGTDNLTVVTTQIGATAHLPCTIHHIGKGVVSWIRKKDYHLLTVGRTTYSSDERFSATHLKHSDKDWTLQIKFVQERDGGEYECQVSTHPPTSIFLHLNVLEARAEMTGPTIRYLTPGSTLKLVCRVVQNIETTSFIFWYHDNRMINYDADRGINVSTEADNQFSELTILHTRREHSGNYSCVPSHALPASVLIHIFKGDNPAAMYHDHRNAAVSYICDNTNYAVLFVLAVLVNIGRCCD